MCYENHVLEKQFVLLSHYAREYMYTRSTLHLRSINTYSTKKKESKNARLILASNKLLMLLVVSLVGM